MRACFDLSSSKLGFCVYVVMVFLRSAKIRANSFVGFEIIQLALYLNLIVCKKKK
ncbi:hypothetical protein BDF21DRAFT_407387 [Thamnidium elegans]|nr:hypothetical protein BDF21DRAFT_407387 [Thamnidium elegans]